MLKKSGAWFSYEDQRIGQGRDNARRYIKENPALFDTLTKQLREAFDVGGIEIPPESGARG